MRSRKPCQCTHLYGVQSERIFLKYSIAKTAAKPCFSSQDCTYQMSRAMRRLRTGYAALHTSDEAAEDEDAAAEPGCAALA